MRISECFENKLKMNRHILVKTQFSAMLALERFHPLKLTFHTTQVLLGTFLFLKNVNNHSQLMNSAIHRKTKQVKQFSKLRKH